MSGDKLLTQQPPEGQFLLYRTGDGQTRIECRFEGDIDFRPTIRNFRIVRPERSRRYTAVVDRDVSKQAVSDHFVDVNKMVDLAQGSQFEVADA